MAKTILITGSTDGIGLETAKLLTTSGHTLLIHGRNQKKLDAAVGKVSAIAGAGHIESYVADLSKFEDVIILANQIRERHQHLDVLINNAGVLKTPNPITANGLDVRFVVNTIAPYLLTQELRTIMDSTSRVVNVSSAAQTTVNLNALAGRQHCQDDMDAYGQSKLAITMWTSALADAWKDGPMVVAVNPGSLLASKMVRDGFGVDGNDIRIGADILSRAALSEEFENATGQYFDNDAGRFAQPHPDALDQHKCDKLVASIEEILTSANVS
ncbi:MAG: SDR family NAD(P)-dependent oxidoreductase [Hyphomicrobiaceae bacterium]